MEHETCNKIIEYFEAVQARPAMYTGKSYDYAWMIQLVSGFRHALEVTGLIEFSFDELKKAYAKRGWNEAYFGAVEEMKSKGLEGDAIVRELLAVELEFWRDFSNRID